MRKHCSFQFRGKKLLPFSVQHNIQALLEAAGSKPSLVKARTQLTQRYRGSSEQPPAGFGSPAEAISYVATRMPATFAAVEAVLSHVPLEDIASVLDLGAGPGTATLAASLRWPKCAHLHLIEGDAFMSGLSQQLLKNIPEMAPQKLSFQHANLLNMSLKDPYDLVLLSYVLNELSPGDQERVLKQAWEKSTRGVVIVMPGTPNGYQQLMVLRDLLIDSDAFIVAPCPHHDACPLVNDDWCHFSTRLSRSSIHRSIKDVSLSYEDEKFSYIVALREPTPRSSARIIRKPLKRSGHVTLDLCAKEGQKRQTISKRDKAYYKTATNAIWGDDWDL